MHLLIAEDDKISRDLLRRIVESEGHTVVLAPDGEAAWRRLNAGEEPFDAAIFDICMPEAGGLDVLERMRASEEFKQIPVILCSAVSDRVTVQRAASLAVSHYVVKPYSRAVMLEKLRRIREGITGISELEAAEIVCQRLGIDLDTHREMLGSVIEDGVSWSKATREARDKTAFQGLFVRTRGLKGSCLSMGAKGLATKLEAAEAAIQGLLDLTESPYPEMALEQLAALLTDFDREMETVRHRGKVAA
jgi:DNA-binding response OmpR family regulator